MKKIQITLIACLLCYFNINAQWEWQNPLPQGNSIYGLSFIDENNGWAVGFWGTIMHTTDGSITWQMQESGIENPLEDVYFTDLLNGWAVGGQSVILNTSDGGITWSPQSLGGTRLPSSLTGVWFVDQHTGWIVGWGAVSPVPRIYHTTNGGNTWEEQSCSSNNSLMGVCFIDESEGWAVGKVGTIIQLQMVA